MKMSNSRCSMEVLVKNYEFVQIQRRFCILILSCAKSVPRLNTLFTTLVFSCKVILAQPVCSCFIQIHSNSHTGHQDPSLLQRFFVAKISKRKPYIKVGSSTMEIWGNRKLRVTVNWPSLG